MRYAAVAALAGAALATPLTVIDPCPAAPTTFPAITVTAQYQPVSSCVPTSTCHHHNCTTEYPMTTSTYVSTVIPCAVNGTSASSCTVTTIDQVVPCSEYATTITSITAIPTITTQGNKTYPITSYSTSYEMISKEYYAPFDHIGPMGIPGYEGSDLCTECDVQSDGSRSQVFEIKECHNSEDEAPVCSNYAYTWISKPAPSTVAPATATCSSHDAVSQAGTYTYTFPQVAPETTITSDSTTVTIPAQPWFAHVTTSCTGPTTFDFVVTVTRTITYTVPYSHTSAGSVPASVPANYPANAPANAPASTTNGYVDWAVWQSTAAGPAPIEASPTSYSQAPASPTNQPWYPSASSQSVQWGAWANSTTSAASTASTTGTMTSSSQASPSGTSGSTFYISVIANPGQRFRKRAPKYVGFGGDDATTVDRSGAAAFSFDSQGELTTGGDYIQRDVPSGGFMPFEKDGTPSGGSSKFQCTIGSPLILAGASFCLQNDAIIINFGSSPGGCVPCSLICGDGTYTPTSSGTWTTSTTVSTSASITTTSFSVSATITSTPVSTTYTPSTTTSSIPDISADLDAPEPTSSTGPRKFRGMRYMY